MGGALCGGMSVLSALVRIDKPKAFVTRNRQSLTSKTNRAGETPHRAGGGGRWHDSALSSPSERATLMDRRWRPTSHRIPARLSICTLRVDGRKWAPLPIPIPAHPAAYGRPRRCGLSAYFPLRGYVNPAPRSPIHYKPSWKIFNSTVLSGRPHSGKACCSDIKSIHV